MIPLTLEECFPALDKLLCDEDKSYLAQATNYDQAAVTLHHSLGRYLRCEWRLWGGSPLAQSLRTNHGFMHPDDMSHFILVEYMRSRHPTCWQRIVSDDML